MVALSNREENSKLKQLIVKAEDKQVISKEEAGFAITLVERFRSDIEKKTRQIDVLRGELSQLQTNELVIVELINNMIKAADRDLIRREAMNSIKEKTKYDNTMG
jgi:hypothetical protein